VQTFGSTVGGDPVQAFASAIEGPMSADLRVCDRETDVVQTFRSAIERSM